MVILLYGNIRMLEGFRLPCSNLILVSLMLILPSLHCGGGRLEIGTTIATLWGNEGEIRVVLLGWVVGG